MPDLLRVGRLDMDNSVDTNDRSTNGLCGLSPRCRHVDWITLWMCGLSELVTVATVERLCLLSRRRAARPRTRPAAPASASPRTVSVPRPRNQRRCALRVACWPCRRRDPIRAGVGASWRSAYRAAKVRAEKRGTDRVVRAESRPILQIAELLARLQSAAAARPSARGGPRREVRAVRAVDPRD